MTFTARLAQQQGQGEFPGRLPKTFSLELRRQAIADLSKLNDSRVRSQAMVTLYGSFRFSASTEAKRFRNMVASLLAPPDAEKTSGVKAALSTSRTLSS